MELCFGVFATILKCCTRGITQEKLVAKLAKCVNNDSNYIAINFRYSEIENEAIEGDKPAISKLINCKKNFFFSEGNDIKMSEFNAVIEKLNICIIPFISDKGKIKFILALVRVIQLDKSIDCEEKEIFKEVFGVDKKQFLEQSEYNFLDILGKTLFYTVNSEVENIKGADCIKTITQKYVDDEFTSSRYDYEWDSDKGSLKLLRYKLRNLFDNLLLKYNIGDFVESVDPTDNIDLSEWINKVEEFEKDVEDQIWNQYNTSSRLLKEIQNFSQILDDYLQYLSLNMRPADVNLDLSVPLHRDENIEWSMDFENNVITFHSKLRDSYKCFSELVMGNYFV